MGTALAYPHIEKATGTSARLQRVRAYACADRDGLHRTGWSADEMCRQHAYLSQRKSTRAMAYYFDHQGEIDEEIRAELRQDETVAKRQATPLSFCECAARDCSKWP